VHANSPEAIPARLEALGALGGLGRLAVHAQVGAALDVCLQVRRRGDGHRYLAEFALLEAGSDGLVRTIAGASFGPDGHLEKGPGFARLERLVA